VRRAPAVSTPKRRCILANGAQIRPNTIVSVTAAATPTIANRDRAGASAAAAIAAVLPRSLTHDRDTAFTIIGVTALSTIPPR
jgi:hypothetical protein